MKVRTSILLVVFCAATIAEAQTLVPAGRATGGPIDRSPLSGTVIVDLHPTTDVISLEQLVEAADLIVDGTVISGVPVNYDPNRRTAIETHSRIAVNTLIKGSNPSSDKGFLILAQEGGKIGHLEVVARYCPVVKSGERYIFFLGPDERELPPKEAGLARYYLMGIWAGLARVESNKVRFADHADEALRQSNDTPVEEFVSLLIDTLHHRAMDDFRVRPIVPPAFRQPAKSRLFVPVESQQ